MSDSILCRYREIGPERRKEFLSVGYKQRHVFAHQIYYLPKCGPDGLRLARNMCGSCELNELNEIVLYAHPSELAEFPEEIFFDDELCWHQQQFGKIGQVAAVDLVWRGTELYSMAHQSDVVQRATRRRQFRTRLQNVFKGWSYMLLNALLNFAVEHSVQTIFIPTASLALRNTDPARKVKRALFERIYNQQVQTFFRATAAGEWWKVNVRENLHRLIRPEIKTESRSREKVICLCHDIERGLGHLDSDPQFAQAAERSSAAGLAEMLRVERAMGVHATYNVVGRLLPGLREPIESQGHCLAFHSYDHRGFEKSRQLARCRTIDYRLKGYRPPQSKITAELSDENLCYYNFEWLASSSYSLGIHAPRMINRLVKIPIEFDDYELYRSSMDWQAWEKQALDAIDRSDFIAFSMHDCYSQFWLPHYQSFLDKVCSLGRLQTMNEVLNQTLMSHAV
jgi:hypothetical protein